MRPLEATPYDAIRLYDTTLRDGTQREGLHDVGAALHAAVHEHLHVRPHRPPYIWQTVDGCARRVELPTAVVAHL